MQIPRDIAAQWAGFVAEWCLGIEPVEAPSEVERAFDALRRLWPEFLSELETQSSRGLVKIVPTIVLGRTLAACEPLRGFGSVAARLRRGEESALAELEFAAALVRCGFTPTLEPKVGKKTLDCSVGIGSERVFAEVIAPEQGEVIRDAQTTLLRMAAELVYRNMGTRTEVLLSDDPEPRFDAILDAATTTPPASAVHNVEGVGWVRRDLLGPQPPDLGPLIANPDPRPVIAVGRMARDEGAMFTSATVRLPITDARAHRLLSKSIQSETRGSVTIGGGGGGGVRAEQPASEDMPGGIGAGGGYWEAANPVTVLAEWCQKPSATNRGPSLFEVFALGKPIPEAPTSGLEPLTCSHYE